jgi:hypothetical protein
MNCSYPSGKAGKSIGLSIANLYRIRNIRGQTQNITETLRKLL